MRYKPLTTIVFALCLITTPNRSSGQVTALWGLSYYPNGMKPNTDSTAMIYFGGFSTADTSRANGLAQWTGTGWDTTPFAGGSGDTTSASHGLDINSMANRNDTLFVGLNWNNWWIWQNDSTFGHSAYLANGQWHPCGAPANDPPSSLDKFTVFEANGRIFGYHRGDTLYGQYSPGLKEWRNGQYVDVKGIQQINPNFSPSTVEYWQGAYHFVGSDFTTTDYDRELWIFDGDSTWTMQSADYMVKLYQYYDCAGYGDSLFCVANVGPSLGGNSGNQSGIWDGNSWHPFFNQFQQRLPLAVGVHGGYLYIVGRFSFGFSGPFYRILRFDGQHLCAIGGAHPGPNVLVHEYHHLGFLGNDLYTSDWGYFNAYALNNVDMVVPDTCFDLNAVGVLDENRVAEKNIHPNPFTHTINLPGLSGNARFELYDFTGKLLLNGQTTGQSIEGLDKLPRGNYSLLLRTDKGVQRLRVLKE